MKTLKETKLVGNIISNSKSYKFLYELEKLMEKYKIDKIDMAWSKFKSI